VLLETGMSDVDIARRRQLSPRTIEDHKRKVLEIFGATMETSQQGFFRLSRELGIRPGDLVNDQAGQPACPRAHRTRDALGPLQPQGISESQSGGRS
jgi:hypothetical protein